MSAKIRVFLCLCVGWLIPAFAQDSFPAGMPGLNYVDSAIQTGTFVEKTQDPIPLATKERILLGNGRSPARNLIAILQRDANAVSAAFLTTLKNEDVPVASTTTRTARAAFQLSTPALDRLDPSRHAKIIAVETAGFGGLFDAPLFRIRTGRYNTMAANGAFSTAIIDVVDTRGVFKTNLSLIVIDRTDNWTDNMEVRWTHIKLPLKGSANTRVVTETEVQIVEKVREALGLELAGYYFSAECCPFLDVELMGRIHDEWTGEKNK